MERLQSATVTIEVNTDKQSATKTLQLGDAESPEESALRVAQAIRASLALRVAQAIRASLGDSHAVQEYAPPGTCPCRLCPAPAVRDGYCRGHQ